MPAGFFCLKKSISANFENFSKIEQSKLLTAIEKEKPDAVCRIAVGVGCVGSASVYLSRLAEHRDFFSEKSLYRRKRLWLIAEQMYRRWRTC